MKRYITLSYVVDIPKGVQPDVAQLVYGGLSMALPHYAASDVTLAVETENEHKVFDLVEAETNKRLQ